MRISWLVLAILLCMTFIANAPAQIVSGVTSPEKIVMSNLASQSMAFTENRGQWGDKTLFKAEAGGATFYFCRDEVAYLFIRDTDELEEPPYPEIIEMPDKFDRPCYKKEALLIKAQFVGANPEAEVIGKARLPHNCNYFYSNDQAKWRTDVPNYASVTYKDIWPGIDLKYHGDGRGMKYDFIVNPGADISQIRIRYDGVEDLSITDQGDLQAQTRFGLIYENIPFVYQEISIELRNIMGRYVIVEPGVFGFALRGDYDPVYPLVIDPELVYSTYLGGSSADNGRDIAVDASGHAYVIGTTSSSDFPTADPYDGIWNGQYDVILTKFSSAGDSLVYSTYLGGSGTDYGRDIAVDDSGFAYITGITESTDFPMANPYDNSLGYFVDAFVAKLSSAGNSLVYSTYLGGSHVDEGNGIAVDDSGNAYVRGWTISDDFPTANPYDGSRNGQQDAFVTKFSSAGNSLVYSTYLGGGGGEAHGYGIAVDDSGNAYVTGLTDSPDFPTANPYDGNYNGAIDVFVTKFSSAGNSLVYSTYLGGSSEDRGYGIAVDASGNAYVTGTTWSSDFPMANPFDGIWNGNYDVFVTKFSSAGNALVYSTYLGGSSRDEGYGIAVDLSGNAYIAGWIESADFPMVNPYDDSYNGGLCDAFVAKFSFEGDSLVYSTYLGGNSSDYGYGIAVDSSGDAYVTGGTFSPDFPTANPYDGSWNGNYDVFVTKFGPVDQSCRYFPGDINGNDQANGIDVTYGVSYLKGGSAPRDSCDCPPTAFPFYAAMDVNGNCAANGIDITYFVAYLKGQQPALLFCADCPPAGPAAPPAPAVMPIEIPSIKERGNLRPSN